MSTDGALKYQVGRSEEAMEYFQKRHGILIASGTRRAFISHKDDISL